jgi:hypothetical protein
MAVRARGEQATDGRDHGIRFPLDLGMGEADDPIPPELQEAISPPIALEGERIVVEAQAVGFDDESFFRPEEVDLEGFAAVYLDWLIAGGNGQAACPDQCKEARLQLAAQVGSGRRWDWR